MTLLTKIGGLSKEVLKDKLILQEFFIFKLNFLKFFI
jgi:hypothetical protein